jgi:DNA polymerase-3 subunit gamma/tau
VLREKYSPEDWYETRGNKDTTKEVKERTEEGHKSGYSIFIFTGPPNSGKKTLANIIYKDIDRYAVNKYLNQRIYFASYIDYYPSDYLRPDFLKELNETLQYGRYAGTVILNEADKIPKDVQESLQFILSNKEDNQCVILIGNDPSKFTDTIKEICISFSFKPLSSTDILDRLQEILFWENIRDETTRDILPQIVSMANGDIRKAIDTLITTIKKVEIITDDSSSHLFKD